MTTRKFFRLPNFNLLASCRDLPSTLVSSQKNTNCYSRSVISASSIVTFSIIPELLMFFYTIDATNDSKDPEDPLAQRSPAPSIAELNFVISSDPPEFNCRSPCVPVEDG